MVATKNPFFEKLLAAMREVEAIEAWHRHGRALQAYQEARRKAQASWELNRYLNDLFGVQMRWQDVP
jgi:hypothetical protein